MREDGVGPDLGNWSVEDHRLGVLKVGIAQGAPHGEQPAARAKQVSNEAGLSGHVRHPAQRTDSGVDQLAFDEMQRSSTTTSAARGQTFGHRERDLLDAAN